MTQIKGTQILSQSTDFSIFVVDENGNIQLPANVQLNGEALATESALTNVLNSIQISKKVEKVSVDVTTGKYNISSVPLGDVQVSINGVIQTPGDDYTIDGQTINFETAPAANDVVVASYITSA